MPSSLGWTMESRPNVVASSMNPMPVTSQAMRAGPGAAAAEISVESAKTPEPIEELMTRAIRPKRSMPFLRGASAAAPTVSAG